MVDYEAHTELRSVDRQAMHPSLLALYDYWAGLASGGSLPVWGGAAGSGFRLVDIPPAVLPIMTIVEVGPEDGDFVYRYWGTDRNVFQGTRPDPTGRPVLTGVIQANAANVLQQYKDVYADGKPHLFSNSYQLPSGISAECQTLRLPLSKGGPGVGMIAAASIFLDHAEEFKKLRQGMV
tara:strand:- start:428 stop:964 length:537 start_codon:yes stop_codon:yes gene_type:complete